jgi:hypothetical protein
VLRDLAARLGLDGRPVLDPRSVLCMLSSLPVPSSWVDPVTQIWPSHISGPYLQARDAAVEKKAGQAESDTERGTGESLEQAMGAGLRPPTPTAQAELEEEAAQRLVRRFPEFFELYGYL